MCPVMVADGSVHFSERACDDCVYVCASTTNLCISDWIGNWSDPVRSHYRNLSSVLIHVRSGEMFRSTSSTDTTTHRERAREREGEREHYCNRFTEQCKICSISVWPFYLEAVFKLLTDKVEGNWVDAGV